MTTSNIYDPGDGGPQALRVVGRDGVSVASGGVASGLVSATRPNNITVYSIGDVVGATAAVWTFPSMQASSGGEVLLTSVVFYRGSSALESGEGSYTLHLYSASPASSLADNATWDITNSGNDRAVYEGKIDLGTPVDVGGTIVVSLDQVNKQVTSSDGNLYGYLVTNAAYTPQAQSSFSLKLHGVKV